MKKKSLLVILLVYCLCLCSCNKKNGSRLTYEQCKDNAVENKQAVIDICQTEKITYTGVGIDLSKAKLILPEGKNGIANLKCDWGDRARASIEQRFRSDIDTLTGGQTDENAFYYFYRDDEINENVKANMSEVSEEQGKRALYLTYNDGIYSSVLYINTYMAEYCKAKTLTELTGMGYDPDFCNRGIDVGVLQKTYVIDEATDSDELNDVYNINGVDISVKDAIAFAEEYMNNNYSFVSSEKLVNRVYVVDVYKYNNRFNYMFSLLATYDNIEFNAESGMGEMYGDETDYDPFAVHHKASMFNADELTYIWSCCHNYENVSETSVEDKLITPDDACRILDSTLSEDSAFIVDEIKLVYETDFYYPENKTDGYTKVDYVSCHPAYRFVIENPDVTGYRKLCFLVDAVTGDVGSYYE